MTNYTSGMNQVLDTHQAVKELIREGLPEGQAEAIVSFQVRFLNENVATKQDIAAVQKDIEALRLETKKDIESLRAETQQSSVAVHKDIALIHKDIESLKGEIKKDMQLQSSQLIIRMGGMLVMAVGLLGGLQIFVG